MDIQEVIIRRDVDKTGGDVEQFQVISITLEMNDGSSKDLSNMVEQGQIYFSKKELLEELNLGVDEDVIIWD